MFDTGFAVPRPVARTGREAAVLGAALGFGALVAYSPLPTILGALACALVAVAVLRPALAGYLLVAVTPLVAGIDRGQVIPLFRPGEAVALLLGGALAVRGLLRRRSGERLRPKIHPVEIAIVLVAVANSVVPLLWMVARERPISLDDLLYALVMWKFLGIYTIVRVSIKTREQVQRCLWIALGAGAVVAAIAILQSIGLFGVPRLVATYYSPFGYTNLANNSRGSSTLGLPAATADLMIYNLAIAAGLAIFVRRHRLVLSLLGGLFVTGAVAAGEFSSWLGLLIGVCCLVAVTGQRRLFWLFAPVVGFAAVALRAVIAKRLNGFDQVTGLPASWTGRLSNLQNNFWPRLFSDANVLFGVQPAARIPAPTQGTGYVWIESGYTWLLWGGGIPLLAGFAFLVCVTIRFAWRQARRYRDAVGVAALAVFVATVVITVLMIFDPHLTYRGSAETYFALLAMAGVAWRAPEDRSESRDLAIRGRP
ncbi:O-antigen ligase family protein [Amycolatopsis thermophila]|uniref:Uncharacterized protein n=1 Tax=Amycolatopsis thermophila TaxID=206084 RepID=A0ABU0F1T5_9PSEU|nr:hypothetical protein [Amycolatopsis thermophila]MDQ0381542.1 hypothetical protein [Amycolatopsis thermophila]